MTGLKIPYLANPPVAKMVRLRPLTHHYLALFCALMGRSLTQTTSDLVERGLVSYAKEIRELLAAEDCNWEHLGEGDGLIKATERLLQEIREGLSENADRES